MGDGGGESGRVVSHKLVRLRAENPRKSEVLRSAHDSPLHSGWPRFFSERFAHRRAPRVQRHRLV